jgi:tetratricopeptide (TPR) repeat protein
MAKVTANLTLVCVALIVGFPGPSVAASTPQDELGLHLASMKKRAEDRARPLAERERIVAEMAATLDRAAQGAATVDSQRGRWSEAADLLDWFNKENEGHPRKSEFALLAATCLSRQAETWSRQSAVFPTDSAARKHATDGQDQAITRLRAILATKRDAPEPTIQDAKIQLARILLARARLDPTVGNAFQKRTEEALGLVNDDTFGADRRAIVASLRAEILCALGRFPEAWGAAESAQKARPPLRAEDRVPVEALCLAGLKRFDEALMLVDTSPLNAAERNLSAVRILVAKRTELRPGPVRDGVDREIIQRIDALRATGKPEARLAVLALALGIDRLDDASDPRLFEALADGRFLAGNTADASELFERGAKRARSHDQPELDRQLRYRAAATLFQDGKFDRVDHLLSDLVKDPDAGPLGPKASLLRIFTRGKQLSAGTPGVEERYVEAIERHLQQFADDPSAAEALWLWGKLLESRDRDEQAIDVWTRIEPAKPRWLDATLAISRVQRAELEELVESDDRDMARRTIETLRADLGKSIKRATDPAERAAIELERARVELIPHVGDGSLARQTLDHLRGLPLRADVRERLSLLRLAALLQEGAYSDADRLAQSLSKQVAAAAILDVGRLLDLGAATSDSDLVRRRYGEVIRSLLAALVQNVGGSSPRERAEIEIAFTRAQLFRGDAAAARSFLSEAKLDGRSLPLDLLRRLAATYALLEANREAIESYRLLGHRTRPASRGWLESRLGMALAMQRAGDVKAARQLVEATTLLHPDLGGGALRARFERLRLKLGLP